MSFMLSNKTESKNYYLTSWKTLTQSKMRQKSCGLFGALKGKCFPSKHY